MTTKGHVDERTKTAYHEAGHALAHFVLHIRFDGVTIKPSPETDTLGQLIQEAPRAISVNDLQGWQVDEEIIACFAGPSAEARISGRTCWPKGSNDFQFAFDLAAKLDHLHVEDIDPYLRDLWARAKNLLKRPGHWLGVERVAAALLQREVLSYSEVAGILQASLEYPQPPMWRLRKSPASENPLLCSLIRRSLRRGA